MAAYIQTGLMDKMLLSSYYTETPLIRNSRWHELETKGEALDNELEALRHRVAQHSMIVYMKNESDKKTMERIRALRKLLSAIDGEQRIITFELNPRYVAYWGLA